MTHNSQTGSAGRSETVAFRTSATIKRLLEAAAERHDVLPSDWLRARVEQALAEELGERALGRPARSPTEVARDGYRAKELSDGHPEVSDA